jgi:hypothetical protein
VFRLLKLRCPDWLQPALIGSVALRAETLLDPRAYESLRDQGQESYQSC